jgi:RNA polymerase sigma-70 factor (ECF subfamily)
VIGVTLREIADAVSGTVHGGRDDILVTAPAFVDSRKASKGGLFVALPGERVDGHDYIQPAMDGGAVAVLAQRPVGVPAVVVKDGVEALGFGHVYAMTGNLRDAEGCAQEAYARAWEQWAKLSAEHGNPEAWVRTMATRLAVSTWRRALGRLKAHRRDDQVTEVSGMNPDHIAVVSALRRISADQRTAIVLYHYAGLSIEEIGDETGVKASTATARLARGRRALAPYLSEFAESLDVSRGPVRTAAVQPHLSRREI